MGGVYKWQGHNLCKLMTCTYQAFLVHDRSGVGVALAGAVCAGCVIFASGVGGVGDGGVLGVGAGGDGPMVRVPGTLGGSALLGLLLAVIGHGSSNVQSAAH